MINVDGVIIGNYRTSMAGNDLNRRYVDPDFRLHPEICAIKNLVSDLIYGEIVTADFFPWQFFRNYGKIIVLWKKCL